MQTSSPPPAPVQAAAVQPVNAQSPSPTPSGRAPLERGLWIVLIAGCLLSMLSFGTRSSFGLFLTPVSGPEGHGFGREAFAIALAFQNLAWGVGQPIAGALSDRFGPWRVLAAGGAVYAAGLALMTQWSSPAGFTLAAGLMVGMGMAGAGHNTVLAALAQLMPEQRRTWAVGLATAASSLGQLTIVPLGQAFIEAYGWAHAGLLLACAMALSPLLALALRGDRVAQAQAQGSATASSMGEALRQASSHRSYWLLIAGFFVCGFQLSFITVHLPPYLNDLGISGRTAAWALGLIGAFNILGSYLGGVLSATMPRRVILAGIYALRAVVTTVFLLVPISDASVLMFGAAMGVLWLSTVPPTAQLVSCMFGTRYMSTLFGFVFLSHQVGAFAGVWLAARLQALTGSYDVVWWLSVVLAVFAALVHLPIRERLWAPRSQSALAT